MKTILASSSPRRFELLSTIIKDFEVVKPECEENNLDTPIKTVKHLASIKADAIVDNYDLLISADTIVVYHDTILGKPKDADDAIKMLSALRGVTHKVYTGVCIKYKEKGRIKKDVFAVCSRVKLKDMTTDEIRGYVNTGSPLDKAGSYGIQDGIVQSYRGSYTNIVGLPVEKLTKKLKRHRLI